VKSLHKNLKIVIVFFLIFSVLFPVKQFVHADAITDSRKNISPDKTWTITFNSNVDYNFVNSNYISVQTLSGKAVDASVSVEPTNQKKVDVSPKGSNYLLGQTYILTIKQGFSDEKGHALKQDKVMQFTIKSTLVDKADFNVKVNNNYNLGIVIVSLNSISDSSNITTFKVEGQDDPNEFVNINGGEAYITSNKLQNLNVYFYDASGKQVGNSLIDVQQATSSQVVDIKN